MSDSTTDRDLGAHPVRDVARKAMMGFVVLVGLMSLAEVALRWVLPMGALQMNPEETFFLVDHPTLLWVQRPNLDVEMPGGWRLQTNSQGLRGPEVPPKQGRRVLSLGESTTWGHGVALSETYGQFVADQLGVEVINAGVPAYTIWQSYLYLRDHGLQLDPDVVLIYHQSNDFLPTHVLDRRSYLYKVNGTDRELTQRRQRFVPLFTPLLQSHLYLFVRKQTLVGQAWVAWATGEGEPLETQVRVPEADRRAALAGILELCQDAGIELVVIEPFYETPYDDGVLEDFAAEHELLHVDAELARANARGTPFFQDGVHPTAAGHRAIGLLLARSLGSLWSPTAGDRAQPGSPPGLAGAGATVVGRPP